MNAIHTHRETQVKIKQNELFRHRFNWKSNGKFIASPFEVTAFDLNNQKNCISYCFPLLWSGSLLGYCMQSIGTHYVQMVERGSEKKKWKTIWIQKPNRIIKTKNSKTCSFKMKNSVFFIALFLYCMHAWGFRTRMHRCSCDAC